jgi:hypothetical protein
MDSYTRNSNLVERCVDCGGVPPAGVNWVSYDFDNENAQLNGDFHDDINNNIWAGWDWANDINEYTSSALSSKYCMIMMTANQYAVHGDVYADAYGGVDSECNTNDPDITVTYDTAGLQSCVLLTHSMGRLEPTNGNTDA